MFPRESKIQTEAGILNPPVKKMGALPGEVNVIIWGGKPGGAVIVPLGDKEPTTTVVVGSDKLSMVEIAPFVPDVIDVLLSIALVTSAAESGVS
jgi:hypothetical protein